MANGAEFTPTAYYTQADHDAFLAEQAERHASLKIDKRDLMRREFIRDLVLALAHGGKTPNVEFTVPEAGKIFDAIYPPPV